MTADILFSTSFPHGTVDGYRNGCRAGRCPAAITCRDVNRRYAGDYAFARMIDDGMTVAQIVAAEQAAAEAARQAERARKPKRVARPFRLDRTPHTDLQRAVHELHSQGLTDTEIAAKLGKTRDHVSKVRQWLKLPTIRRKTITEWVAELHSQGKTDPEIARALNRTREHVASMRRRLGLPLIPSPRSPIDTADIVRLHGEGLTDTQIAEQLGVERVVIQKRRNNLRLPINKAPAKTGASSSQETTT